MPVSVDQKCKHVQIKIISTTTTTTTTTVFLEERPPPKLVRLLQVLGEVGTFVAYFSSVNFL